MSQLILSERPTRLLVEEPKQPTVEEPKTYPHLRPRPNWVKPPEPPVPVEEPNQPPKPTRPPFERDKRRRYKRDIWDICINPEFRTPVKQESKEEPKQESKEEPKKEPKKGPFIPKRRPKPKRTPFVKPKPEVPKPPFFQKPKRLLKKPRRPRRRRPSRKPLAQIQSGEQIDYKERKLLNNFTSDQGKILSRRATKLHLKQQRLITLAIKKARILSFLPFIYNAKNFERIKPTIIRTAKFRNKKKKFKPKRKNRSFFSKK